MNVIILSIFLSIFGLFNLLGINPDLFWRQLINLLIGLSLYLVIRHIIGRNYISNNHKFFYLVTFLITVFIFFIAPEIKGSRRWLNLYFFNFQSSEFLKIFFISFMASFFSQKGIFENNLRYFMKSFIYFVIPTIFVFKQPDLGNAAVIFFIYMVMMLFSKNFKQNITYFISIFLVLIPIGLFFLKDYQRNRLLSFVNPHLDTQGSSYNMIQAVITIGSGRFLGNGLGLGTQSKLYFLPENSTDFAFASLVEQFGMLGGGLVLIFYGLIFLIIIKKAIKFYYQRDESSHRYFLYCIGLLAFLFFQVVVNIGMNMGVLPIAGIALPLISYGGSSILSYMLALALIP